MAVKNATPVTPSPQGAGGRNVRPGPTEDPRKPLKERVAAGDYGNVACACGMEQRTRNRAP